MNAIRIARQAVEANVLSAISDDVARRFAPAPASAPAGLPAL